MAPAGRPGAFLLLAAVLWGALLCAPGARAAMVGSFSDFLTVQAEVDPRCAVSLSPGDSSQGQTLGVSPDGQARVRIEVLCVKGSLREPLGQARSAYSAVYSFPYVEYDSHTSRLVTRPRGDAYDTAPDRIAEVELNLSYDTVLVSVNY